jgi:hypothetical protein
VKAIRLSRAPTLILLVAAVVVVDGLLSPDLGFVAVGGTPYLVLLLAIASVGSGRDAVVAGTLTFLLLFFIVPLLSGPLGLHIGTFDPSAYSLEQRAALAFGLVVTAGIIRGRSQGETRVSAAEERAREARRAAESMRTESAAMEASLRELYNRHAVESRTITGLGEQLSRFQSYDRATVLDAAVTSARLLTAATSVAVYRVDEATLQLRRQVVWPEHDTDRYEATLDIGSSIEGWVVRTGRAFTLRQLMHDTELAAVDRGLSVIATPIAMRGRIWGVLTIGEMPFLAYNEAAEVSLQIVAALAGGGIEQSFGHAAGTAGDGPSGGRTAPPKINDGADGSSDDEPDASVFGIDRLYGDLTTLLRSSDTVGYVSLFLVELRGIGRRPLSLSHDQEADLVEKICDRLFTLTSGAAKLYRYQLANQFALVGANLGYEAAPYFLLRILETIGGEAWSVRGETVLPEAVVGFSSSRDGDVEVMIDRAEAMLAVQTAETPRGNGG